MLNLGDKNRRKMEKLQMFDSSYFLDKSHFEDGGTQSYLVFPPEISF